MTEKTIWKPLDIIEAVIADWKFLNWNEFSSWNLSDGLTKSD